MRKRKVGVGLLGAWAVLIVALLLIRLIPTPDTTPGEAEVPVVQPGWASVEEVVDGDTVRIAIAGRTETVRVVGIDTPEVERSGKPGGCYGREAAAVTRGWLKGREVRVEPAREQRDRYGRLLASLEPRDGPIGGRDLARSLALAGYARPLVIPPNVDDAPTIEEFTRLAREEGRGLWGACGFERSFPGKRDPAGG